MVKFFDSSFTYDYPFSAVSLAYFLRYPNPYARHVISTDVIDRQFDPNTQQLTTTRLHLKRSKIPAPILKILPTGVLGRSANTGRSYVLEKSIVDVKEGWMHTESRNLEWTGILSVVEKQTYFRQPDGHDLASSGSKEWADATRDEGTRVSASVTLLSRFGQAKMLRRKGEQTSGTSASVPSDTAEEAPVRKGFLASWSTSGLQRSIEAVGLRRTREAIRNSKEGMNVVLERLRGGGLVRVLEGMKQDRQLAFGSSVADEMT